jgi:hypothetical protein
MLCRPNGIGWHRVRRRIKKLIVICNTGGLPFCKRKAVIVKDDMPRDDDPVGRQVKTAIFFV